MTITEYLVFLFTAQVDEIGKKKVKVKNKLCAQFFLHYSTIVHFLHTCSQDLWAGYRRVKKNKTFWGVKQYMWHFHTSACIVYFLPKSSLTT